MHPFTIDFITGNTGSFTPPGYVYHYDRRDTDLQIKEDLNTDTRDESYFNTTQNLEDIYSVISKDVFLFNQSPTDEGPSDNPSPESDCCVRTSDVTERGTPSPTLDSGIDSNEGSPVHVEDEEISKTLKDLDKKAKGLTKSTPTSEKPELSYIALIAKAIISSQDRKMTLGDIYKHIRESHSYYDNEERAWRNSIRYNLSINECFIKAGKEESGKGNYWAIHPFCKADFEKGDYRRRQARRRARRGTRFLDKEPVHNTKASRNTAYAPMTPSYLGYHPYLPNGMVPHHQYPIASTQMYPSTNSAFSGSTPTYFHGNQMLSTATGYSSYQRFMMTPYGYISPHTMDQKKSNTRKYFQNVQPANNSNSVFIQT